PQKGKRICFQICKSSLGTTDKSKKSDLEEKDKMKGENGGGGGTTSFLILVLWSGLMYYVFNLAPNQTPYYITSWVPGAMRGDK
nr:putative cardiolipin synthase [Tanacetum cinerariifolium]